MASCQCPVAAVVGIAKKANLKCLNFVAIPNICPPLLSFIWANKTRQGGPSPPISTAPPCGTRLCFVPHKSAFFGSCQAHPRASSKISYRARISSNEGHLSWPSELRFEGLYSPCSTRVNTLLWSVAPSLMGLCWRGKRRALRLPMGSQTRCGICCTIRQAPLSDSRKRALFR